MAEASRDRITLRAGDVCGAECGARFGHELGAPRSAASGPSILTFFKEPRNLLAWLPIGIFGGGVVEELQRIFIFTRFEKWLGRPGLILGIGLSSVMFGLGHLYQGLGIAISTAVSGVIFSLVYLRRRSALEPITAHAFSDVLAMLGAMLQAR